MTKKRRGLFEVVKQSGVEFGRVFGFFEEEGVVVHSGDVEGVGLRSHGDDEFVVGEFEARAMRVRRGEDGFADRVDFAGVGADDWR